MKVTGLTRRKLRERRDHRDMTARGWEFVGEGGGKLWELYRGCRMEYYIVAAQVSACGKGVWVKIEKEAQG